MKQHLTIDEILSRLGARDCQVKRSGKDYRAQCPAHGGDGLSLAFREGKAGQVLFTCHSHHCSYEDIMRSLGIEKNQDGTKMVTHKSVRSTVAGKKTYKGKTLHPTFNQAGKAAGFGAGFNDVMPDDIYSYPDENHKDYLFVLRWNGPNGKVVRPVTKVEGGYIAGTDNDQLYPIFNLLELGTEFVSNSDKSVRIYVCEGEKATNLGISLGLPTTTSAFGSQSANKSDWGVLDRLAIENRVKLEIVIFPDNDNPGKEYAESLVDIFTKFKCDPMVKVVPFAEFGHVTGIENFVEGGDLYDLYEQLDAISNDDFLEMIQRMIDETLPESQIVEDKLQWEPFPVDLLPKSIGHLCTESAQAKNIESVHVAINALAAVASIVGSAYKIELKKDWREPAILWTCLVCESGSGKTPGLDSAMEPLRLLQKNADASYDSQYLDYEEERENYNLEYDDWKRDKKRRSTEESPEKPMPPAMETFIVDDATLEAVAEVLENNPFGILLLKDELAAWFNSFDCYRSTGGSKDLPSWLSIHGGRPFRINRKTGKKVIRSNNPAVSLCGGIQPNVLFRIVKGNEDFFDSGLTARILFAMPPDKPRHWTEVETSDEALAMYENIFRTLWVWRRDPAMPTPEEPLIVRLSEDAKELFVRFFNSNADERSELGGDMKAAWAKFAGYAARLALIFHVVQRIEDGGPMHVLNGDSMQRAIRLILWFKRKTARILEFLRQTKCETDFESATVLELVEKNGGTITTRELQQRRNKYRGKNGAKLATAILDGLVHKGKLIVSTIMTPNGKDIARYSLV